MQLAQRLAQEMTGANFADPRLAKRLGRIVERMMPDPSRSFPKAMSGAELEGVYRFLGNPNVTPDAILSGHYAALHARCAREEGVLCIHDSSTFHFKEDGARKGLGRLRTGNQTFFGHFSLVISSDGQRRPLGIGGLKTWIRPPLKEDTTDHPHALNNERSRWFELVQTTSSRLAGVPIIHVMDREADDYPLMTQMVHAGNRFVIRQHHNRLLATSKQAKKKLSDVAMQIECEVEREASISKRVDGKRSPLQKQIHPTRRKRVAELAIGAARVTLQRPAPVDKTLAPTVDVHILRIWEPAPPRGESPIEWILYTTEPIDSPEAMLRVVEYYRARWAIEVYFKVLKTGCNYRSRQLDNYEALINALAVFAPMAVELFALRRAAEETPERSASELLSEVQIKVLRTLGRKRLTERPTMREAWLAIAAMGGHIKYSGDPGWLTLWRGYIDLCTHVRSWQAALEHALST